MLRLDQFTKATLQRALSRMSRVRTEYQLAARMQHIDIQFTLMGKRTRRSTELGVLGRMAACGDGMIEAFSTTVTCKQYRRCVRRQLVLEQQRDAAQRRAKQQASRVKAAGTRRARPTLPRLWVLSPGHPVSVVSTFQMRPMEGWPPGFFAPDAAQAQAVVVLSKLPQTRDTLLLRLQGRRATFARAVEELSRLPLDAPERQVVLPDLLELRRKVAQDMDGSKQMSATVKRIEAMYKAWEHEVKEQGVKQGRQEGHEGGLRQALEMMLVRRFGKLPAQVQARVNAADAAELEQWIDRALQAESIEDSLPESMRKPKTGLKSRKGR